jgi:hypothetical protein
VDDPESIATKDLAVVGGIASDKVAKYEGWGNSTRDPGTAVAAVVDRLAALEGRLTITVERTSDTEPRRPPIDTTPSKTAE